MRKKDITPRTSACRVLPFHWKEPHGRFWCQDSAASTYCQALQAAFSDGIRTSAVLYIVSLPRCSGSRWNTNIEGYKCSSCIYMTSFRGFFVFNISSLPPCFCLVNFLPEKILLLLRLFQFVHSPTVNELWKNICHCKCYNLTCQEKKAVKRHKILLAIFHNQYSL